MTAVRAPHSGFTYIGLLILVAIMAVALTGTAQPGLLDMFQKDLLFLGKFFFLFCHSSCLFHSLSLGISFRYGNTAAELSKLLARTVPPLDNIERTGTEREV